MLSVLAGQEGVKPAAQAQQITGTKRSPSGSDAPELVLLTDIGERYGNRLHPAVIVQINDTVLAPVLHASDDVDLSSARRQERMGDGGLCRRHRTTGRSRRYSPTSSSSGSGVRSNMKRSICGPMTASARHGPRSADTWASTIVHHNTHLSMPLKEIGPAAPASILRGVSDCAVPVRRWPGRGVPQERRG